MINKSRKKILIIVFGIIFIAGLVLVGKLFVNGMCLINCDSTLKKDSSDEINESTEISGSLRGYYYTYTKSGEYVDVPFSEKCEAFVVVDGDSKNGDLINKYFTDLVNNGNTVNKLSESNDLIINLDIEDINKLDETESELFKNSTIDNQVVIKVKKLVQDGTEAGPCHSFFDFKAVDTDVI